jgi:Zn-dependent protease with chaperone function
VSWCPRCEWNLHPPPAPEPRTRFQREYLRAGRRWGERVAERLVASGRLAPRWTASKIAAYALAAVIHLFTFGLAAGGIALLVLARGNVFALLGGVVMLGSAWFMRPRLGRVPDEDVVAREQAPELHRLVDEVAATLGTRAPDVLVVDHRYNASWSVLGLRRRRVLELGLPLINALDADERIAVIAHELAHERNGDATRGFVVGSSCVALNELYALISPREPLDAAPRAETAYGGLEAVIGQAVLWGVSRPVSLLLSVQAHLLWHDSRRAEFLADALAAQVAGTAAVVHLHEKTLLAATVQAAAHHAVHHPEDRDFDLFAHARRAVAEVPGHERERRRRAARHEHARLNVTHPPTGQRIALLERRPPSPPAIVLGAGRAAAIDAELAASRERLAGRIVDRYRSSLYR